MAALRSERGARGKDAWYTSVGAARNQRKLTAVGAHTAARAAPAARPARASALQRLASNFKLARLA